MTDFVTSDGGHRTQLPALRSPAGQTLIEYAVLMFLLALAALSVLVLIRL